MIYFTNFSVSWIPIVKRFRTMDTNSFTPENWSTYWYVYSSALCHLIRIVRILCKISFSTACTHLKIQSDEGIFGKLTSCARPLRTVIALYILWLQTLHPCTLPGAFLPEKLKMRWSRKSYWIYELLAWYTPNLIYINKGAGKRVCWRGGGGKGRQHTTVAMYDVMCIYRWTQVSCSGVADLHLAAYVGAPGSDGIKSLILKITRRSIIGPLCYLCNISLTEGVFPDELKFANVLPLFKSGDPLLFNNFRPVSLLCVLSKVFEKVMYSRLLSFLDEQQILIKNNSDFESIMLLTWH